MIHGISSLIYKLPVSQHKSKHLKIKFEAKNDAQNNILETKLPNEEFDIN